MSTIPSAPLEGDTGYPIIFMSYDDGSALAAAIFRAFRTATVQGGTVGELGVYSTSGDLFNFGKTVSSEIAERIYAYALPCQGVIVKALSTNVGIVYVGLGNLTANSGVVTSGFPLDPGESVGLPTRDANGVYVRGTPGDKIACIASRD